MCGTNLIVANMPFPEPIRTLFSIPKIITTYNAYCLYGTAGAIGAATALVGDNITHNKMTPEITTGRNYFRLSAFWGHIAYNACSQIMKSGIPQTFSIPLTIATGLASAAMVYKGPDIFADKTNLHAASLNIVSSFFQDDGLLKGANDSYRKGYIPFLQYVIQHPEIANNKLVRAIVFNQAASIIQITITQKYGMTSNPLPFILALKGNATMKTILQLIAGILGSEVINIAFKKIQDKCIAAISKEIREKIAVLAFKEENTTSVMALGEDLQSFPSNMSLAVKNSFEGPAELVQSITRPLLLNPKYDISAMAILILLRTSLNCVLTQENLKALADALEKSLI
ncbi:MAG UNVERIFIED_CONTAM: hypothetical protein LVQ98_08000 [Rickettsiaceae bacterium]|jgi:hypothetical protein